MQRVVCSVFSLLCVLMLLGLSSASSPSLQGPVNCPLTPVEVCCGVTGCTMNLTAELVSQPEPPPCPGQGYVKITIKLTCGSTECNKVFYKCADSTEQLEFACDGCRRKVGLNGSPVPTWGGIAAGTDKCSGVTNGCNNQP